MWTSIYCVAPSWSFTGVSGSGKSSLAFGTLYADVVVSGSPEEVARSDEGRTAIYLARFLEPASVFEQKSIGSGVPVGSI